MTYDPDKIDALIAAIDEILADTRQLDRFEDMATNHELARLSGQFPPINPRPANQTYFQRGVFS